VANSNHHPCASGAVLARPVRRAGRHAAIGSSLYAAIRQFSCDLPQTLAPIAQLGETK
jgi:hypothetical protein